MMNDDKATGPSTGSCPNPDVQWSGFQGPRRKGIQALRALRHYSCDICPGSGYFIDEEEYLDHMEIHKTKGKIPHVPVDPDSLKSQTTRLDTAENEPTVDMNMSTDEPDNDGSGLLEAVTGTGAAGDQIRDPNDDDFNPVPDSPPEDDYDNTDSEAWSVFFSVLESMPLGELRSLPAEILNGIQLSLSPGPDTPTDSDSDNDSFESLPSVSSTTENDSNLDMNNDENSNGGLASASTSLFLETEVPDDQILGSNDDFTPVSNSSPEDECDNPEALSSFVSASESMPLGELTSVPAKIRNGTHLSLFSGPEIPTDSASGSDNDSFESLQSVSSTTENDLNVDMNIDEPRNDGLPPTPSFGLLETETKAAEDLILGSNDDFTTVSNSPPEDECDNPEDLSLFASASESMPLGEIITEPLHSPNGTHATLSLVPGNPTDSDSGSSKDSFVSSHILSGTQSSVSLVPGTPSDSDSSSDKDLFGSPQLYSTPLQDTSKEPGGLNPNSITVSSEFDLLCSLPFRIDIFEESDPEEPVDEDSCPWFTANPSKPWSFSDLFPDTSPPLSIPVDIALLESPVLNSTTSTQNSRSQLEVSISNASEAVTEDLVNQNAVAPAQDLSNTDSEELQLGPVPETCASSHSQSPSVLAITPGLCSSLSVIPQSPTYVDKSLSMTSESDSSSSGPQNSVPQPRITPILPLTGIQSPEFILNPRDENKFTFRLTLKKKLFHPLSEPEYDSFEDSEPETRDLTRDPVYSDLSVKSEPDTSGLATDPMVPDLSVESEPETGGSVTNSSDSDISVESEPETEGFATGSMDSDISVESAPQPVDSDSAEESELENEDLSQEPVDSFPSSSIAAPTPASVSTQQLRRPGRPRGRGRRPGRPQALVTRCQYCQILLHDANSANPSQHQKDGRIYPTTCKKCLTKYLRFYLCIRHHYKLKLYKCSMCAHETSTRSNALKHLVRHRDPNFRIRGGPGVKEIIVTHTPSSSVDKKTKSKLKLKKQKMDQKIQELKKSKQQPKSEPESSSRTPATITGRILRSNVKRRL